MRSVCGSGEVKFIHAEGKIIRSRCQDITDAKTKKQMSYTVASLHSIISIKDHSEQLLQSPSLQMTW